MLALSNLTVIPVGWQHFDQSVIILIYIYTCFRCSWIFRTRCWSLEERFCSFFLCHNWSAQHKLKLSHTYTWTRTVLAVQPGMFWINCFDMFWHMYMHEKMHEYIYIYIYISSVLLVPFHAPFPFHAPPASHTETSAIGPWQSAIQCMLAIFGRSLEWHDTQMGLLCHCQHVSVPLRILTSPLLSLNRATCSHIVNIYSQLAFHHSWTTCLAPWMMDTRSPLTTRTGEFFMGW